MANRNIDIHQETWKKVGVMAATMNKPKKMVVTEALERYYTDVLRVFPEMKKGGK